MTISEKVAYVKGVFDGMELDKTDSKEAKVLAAVLDVLKEVGEELDNMEETLRQYGEDIDVISDDLADVEAVVYDEDEDEDDPSGCGCCCSDEDFIQAECPNCGESLTIDEHTLRAGSIECPACGQKFALSFEDSGEGDEED